MRYQVPQFVDIEDKIIGPFTLRQFLLYLAAALLCIPLFIFFDISLFITVALPIVGTAAAFAHVRIHSKSLFSTLVNAGRFGLRGQVFLWRRTPELKTLRISGPEFAEFTPGASVAPEATMSLATRAQLLETEGSVVTADVADPISGEADT